MKISIITITHCDGELLPRCLASLVRQKLPADVEMEHILVCTDRKELDAESLSLLETLGSTILERPPRGCYQAMNVGLVRATGDIVGMVHGTDFLPENDRLAIVAEAFTPGVDYVYGDVDYIRRHSPGHVVRYYSARDFKPADLHRGFPPPHPSFYIRRDAMLKVGLYREDFRLGGDFEFFVRLFLCHPELNGRYLPARVVSMELGGLSGQWSSILYYNTRDKIAGLRSNGFKPSMIKIFSRYYDVALSLLRKK